MNQVNLPTVRTTIRQKFGKNGDGGIAKFARLWNHEKYTQQYITNFFKYVEEKGTTPETEKTLNVIYSHIFLVSNREDPKEITADLRQKLNKAVKDMGGARKVAEKCGELISKDSINQLISKKGKRVRRTDRVNLLIKFLKIKE